MPPDKPCMRNDIELYFIEHQGKQLILVRDQLGLIPEGLTVPAELSGFLQLLNGSHDLRSLQMEIMRSQGGTLVETQVLENLISDLDQRYLLNSERFQAALDGIRTDFQELRVRPCSHCGSAYPAEPGELRAMLEEIVPSGKDPAGGSGEDLLAIAAPHIDIRAGKACYAAAYGGLRGCTPQRVVVLGIGHQLGDDWFSVTEKDFETPLGTVKCDREAAAALRNAAGDLHSADDFAHRSEHSIEFQLIFLQHLLPEDSFSIVPILFGGPHLALEKVDRNTYRERAGAFLEKMRQLASDDKTLILAGVDLSHIGLKFGHSSPAATLERPATAHDRVVVDRLVHLDPEGYWEEMLRQENRYNVCGFPALACLLEILPSCRGTLLDSGIYREEATSSAVTFAAAAFRRT